MTTLHSNQKPKFVVTAVASLLMGLSFTFGAVTFPAHSQTQAAIDPSVGQEYVVKSGDGLYKLGRMFYGKGIAYKKIVKAHNEKAKTDSRYTAIDPNQGLEVGQIIWIPVRKTPDGAPATAKQLQDIANKSQNLLKSAASSATSSADMVNVSRPNKAEDTIAGKPIASDYSLPTTDAGNMYGDATAKKDDPAYIVTMPESNCEIRIWYNFQLVAIKKINERWKEQGISLIERAKMAHDLRHEARLNGRYMMKDKFEVAALRDRDNKKYGNPNGPTFEHLVAFAKENGLTGDRIYEGIIESSSRVQPVYKSSCVKK